MRFEIKVPNGLGGQKVVYYDNNTKRLENSDGTLVVYDVDLHHNYRIKVPTVILHKYSNASTSINLQST